MLNVTTVLNTCGNYNASETFRFRGNDDNFAYLYNPCYPINVNGVYACSNNRTAVSKEFVVATY